MRLNLSTALPLLARFAVQGACASDPRVLERINEARQRLMEKSSNWKGKIQRFLFCASNACITLPREIETVEAATVCNRSLRMRSKWYDVLEGGPNGTICGGDAFVDRGDGYVSFADLDEPRQIRVYTDVPEVTGARLLLQGFDENNNRVRTWDAQTGAYVDGEYVEINHDTPAVSVTVFSSLDGIQKPETNGFLRLYAFTAGTASTPASDTTTLVNWAGPSPIGGTLTFAGTLLLDDLDWTGTTQNVDVVLRLTYAAGNVEVAGFTTNGVSIPGINLDVWSFETNDPTSGQYQGGDVIPDTAIALSDPPFVPAATTIQWNDGANRTAQLFFRGDGESNGGGTLWVFDADGTLITQEVVTIPAAAEFSWTPIAVGGLPFSNIVLEAPLGHTMDELFVVGQNYGLTVAQDPIGTLGLELLNTGDVTWNVILGLSQILAPDLWNGAFYTVRLRRALVDAVDSTPDYLALMSILHPDDTHPSYRRYEVPALRAACASDVAGTPRQVIVMAKLRYLPVKQGTDFLVIENIGALKHMLLAINEEEKGDLAKALTHEAKAEEILAQELRNHIGDAASANQGMQVQMDAWAASSIANIL